MSGVVRFLFKVMRGCSPRRQSPNGAGKNGFRQKGLIAISVLSFILGAAPGMPLTVVSAGTPTPAPRAPVITAANANRLKQVGRWGDGVLGDGLAWSPDGKRLAVGSSVGVWLYDAANFGAELRFLDQDGWVRDLAFSPDGQWLAAADDTSVQLWELSSGKKTRAFKGDKVVAFSRDGKLLATRGRDGKTAWDMALVRIFDAATGTPLAVLEAGHNVRVTDLRFSPDGQQVGAVTSNTTDSGCDSDQLQYFQVWDLEPALRLRRVKWNDRTQKYDSILGLRLIYGPDADYALNWAVFGNTGEQQFMNVWTRRGAVQLQPYNPRGGSLSPDGRTIAFVDYHYENNTSSSALKLVDYPTGHLLANLGEYTRAPWEQWIMRFSPDGGLLAVLNGDTVELWDVQTRTKREIVHESQLAFSADASTALQVNQDRRFRVVSLDTGDTSVIAPTRRDALLSVSLSPDGRLFVAAYTDEAQVWNVQTAQVQLVLQDRFTLWSRFQFSPSSRLLVVYHTGIFQERDDLVQLWDVTTGERVPGVRLDISGIDSAVFSADETRLTIAGGRESYLWELQNDSARLLERFSGWFTVLDPTKTQVVFGDNDSIFLQTVGAQSATKLAPVVQRFHSFYDGLSGVFSPDGTLLAVGEQYYGGMCIGNIDNMYLWDLRSLKPLHPWSRGIHNLTYSPNSAVFTSTGEDDPVSGIGSDAIYVWNPRTGGKLALLTNRTGRVTGVTFSPDGTTLLSQSADGTIRRWQVR